VFDGPTHPVEQNKTMIKVEGPCEANFEHLLFFFFEIFGSATIKSAKIGCDSVYAGLDLLPEY